MDTLTAIQSRQGTLRFQVRPVEAESIRQVLEAAAAAPSPANLQPWAFVVITRPELTRQIAAYLVQVQQEKVFDALLDTPPDDTARLMRLYDAFDRAPCFILVCLEPKARFARPEHEATLRDWYLMAAGAALQNLMLAATALELGTRWFGGFSLEAGGAFLKRLLGIPDHVEIVAATPLGYPDEPPRQRALQDPATVSTFQRGDPRLLRRLLRGRLPLESLVHFEQWE